MYMNDVKTSKINKVNIPSSVKYLSEFVPLLPSNVIVNKGLCGVGATTMLFGFKIIDYCQPKTINT